MPILHPQEATPPARAMTLSMGFEAPHYQLDGPHRMVITAGVPRRKWPTDYQYPIELATRSGLFGPWDEPDLTSELPADRLLDGELPGVNPGGIDHWQIANYQVFPNFEILIWETGWYLTYRYWPTSHNTHRFEATLYFAPSMNASDRAAHESAVVMFKEFALQDAGTLEGTQQALNHRAVTRFPLDDQEILVASPAPGSRRLGRGVPGRTDGDACLTRCSRRSSAISNPAPRAGAWPPADASRCDAPPRDAHFYVGASGREHTPTRRVSTRRPAR